MQIQHQIAYALWVPDQHSSNPNLRDITLSWLRFGYQGAVIESCELDTILEQAINQGHQYCFVQMPGNVISEDWMLPHWQVADFHQCLESLTKRDDFLVTADLIQHEGYFKIDPRCMLINLNHYQALGCPSFGYLSTQEQNLIQPSIVEICNNTLAYQLESSQTFQSITPSTPGWNFIDASLRKGLTVPQLPNELSQKRVLLTTNLINTDITSAKLSSSTQTQERFLEGIEQQVTRGREGVFLWNIESYDDITQTNKQPITDLYCVAAGFKPNMLLNKHGFNSNTCVTFFDYSQQALSIRKTLIQEWDGTDYPTFCKEVIHQFPSDTTFYQLWNGQTVDQIDWADVDALWQKELTLWGGQATFKQQWQAQKSLDYRFIHCDLINQPGSLLDAIEGSNKAVIWWSNAFFTITSNWFMSIDDRRQHFAAWIDALAERSPNCQLYGADHNNTPVNNVQALAYSQNLTQRTNSIQFDELVTHQHSAQPLRF